MIPPPRFNPEKGKLVKGEIMRLCFAYMPAAYEEASDHGQLPVPARQMYYALRRLTGLGDLLSSHYVLNGEGTCLLDQYMDAHPETGAWDILRDARGALVERDGLQVPLGTIEVRRCMDGIERHQVRQDGAPQFSLRYPKRGPGDSYGAVVYIEKEGFQEAIAADGIQHRWDFAVASCKGYSVRAARALMRYLASLDLPVLVAHDLDVDGIQIADLICSSVPRAVDVGLRWDDITDDRWDLEAMAESVTYDKDPEPGLLDHGATDEEIEFLVGAGKRVELNALVGRAFIDWLETKLDEHGVAKVVPDDEMLAAAYRRAWARERINRAIADLEQADEIEVPDDLVTLVTNALDDVPGQAWDEVVSDLVLDAYDELDAEAEEDDNQ